AASAQLRQSLAAGTLREAGFLQCALGVAHALTAPRLGHFRLVARVAQAFAFAAVARQLFARGGELVVESHDAGLLGAPFRPDRRPLVANLRTTARGRFGLLTQLQKLELQVVTTTLLRRQCDALAVVLLLSRLEVGLRSIERGGGRSAGVACAGNRVP